MGNLKPTGPLLNRASSLSTGLVGAWALHEGSGTVSRATVGPDAAINGAARWAVAADWNGIGEADGHAVHVAGTAGAEVALGSHLVGNAGSFGCLAHYFNSGLTYCVLWCSADGSLTQETMFLNARPSAQLQFVDDYGGSAGPTSGLFPNGRNPVVVTRRASGTFTVYVRGLEVLTGVSALWTVGSEALGTAVLGRRGSGGLTINHARYLTAALWNRELSSDEAKVYCHDPFLPVRGENAWPVPRQTRAAFERSLTP